MKKIIFCLVALFSLESFAINCTYKKQVLWREASATTAEFREFTPEYIIDITDEVYGVVTGYFNGKLWKDFWFSPITCSKNSATSSVTFEYDNIPIAWPPKPKTIWVKRLSFNYGQVYEWSDKIGNKEFLFRFSFY
jgi:hypothetical protein